MGSHFNDTIFLQLASFVFDVERNQRHIENYTNFELIHEISLLVNNNGTVVHSQIKLNRRL